MDKHLCWMSKEENGTKELYYREFLNAPWKHYSQHPHKVPDYPIKGGSKGFATYQFLCSQGWILVPSNSVVR